MPIPRSALTGKTPCSGKNCGKLVSAHMLYFFGSVGYCAACRDAFLDREAKRLDDANTAKAQAIAMSRKRHAC